jgi:hypothetical protein
MRRIYIGHPLVGDGSCEWGNMARNVERYLRFCAMFTNAGHTVVSWVHHYLMHERKLTTGNADFYLERDAKLIAGSDIFVQAAPASVSNGLQFEIAEAKRLFLPVLYRAEWQYPHYYPEVLTPARDVSAWIDNARTGGRHRER